MTVANPLKDVLALAQRFQDNEPFRRYVAQRSALLVPFALIALFVSLACAFGSVLFIGGTRPLLVLLGLVVAPFVLIGSFCVQAYVFLAWLEIRALATALGHDAGRRGRISAWLKRTIDADMGTKPPVPWVLVAIFLGVPLAMLASAWPAVAAAAVVLLAVAPVAFARLDR